MLEQEINSILNMNIPNFKKSEMIQILIDQKNSNVKMFEEGGKIDPDTIMKKVLESDADFVNRLKDPNRATLDLGDGIIGTHKMSYAETNGKFIVYPEIQNINGELIDLSTDRKKALKSAIDRGDFIEFDSEEEAKWFTKNYKDYLKTFKYKEGGEVKSKIQYNKEISISGKPYKVAIAKTEEEKETGLSKINSLPEGCGMLFVYEEPQENLWFTMADTSIDLDIIFIDEEGTVTQVSSVSAYDPHPIIDRKGNAQFVLELNINSGIRRGDELDDYDDDEDEEELTPEEKETNKQSKMLVLDKNGDVQMKLEGGERIFSRIFTRKFIKAALKAYKTDNDSDYKRVGRMILKELNAQDNRPTQYVNNK